MTGVEFIPPVFGQYDGHYPRISPVLVYERRVVLDQLAKQVALIYKDSCDPSAMKVNLIPHDMLVIRPSLNWLQSAITTTSMT
jgi:hypothetical protein